MDRESLVTMEGGGHDPALKRENDWSWSIKAKRGAALGDRVRTGKAARRTREEPP